MLNKFSSPEEVKTHYEGWDMKIALRGHIDRFYSRECNPCGMDLPELEKAIRTLSTKAMEAL